MSRLLEYIHQTNSAVDIGCGVGTWLSIVAELTESTEICGFDGDWVDREFLRIPQNCFHVVDLTEGIKIEGDKQFDLAISLEVAEHINPDVSQKFVKSLTTLSDFVLFSAAIPFQGGAGHVNEQWLEYWVEEFSKHRFTCLDIIREHIWSDRDIPVWYRQNIVLFVKNARLDDVKRIEFSEHNRPLAMVHPELFLTKIRQAEEKLEHAKSLCGSARYLLRALKSKVILRS
jgi:SAM-dependent methyltransferase